jgi:hypothetical protein
MLARQLGQPSAYARLMTVLLRRSARFGHVAELDRVVELGDRAVEEMPTRAEAYELRASAHNAVHRFRDGRSPSAP